MKGRWKVTSNTINGKTMYSVFRLCNTSQIDHSGNREYASRDNSSPWTEDRALAQGLADELNLIDTKERFEMGANPTALMNELEHEFKIPAMNDEAFNEKHPEVMDLYRQISDSRFKNETENTI